MEGADAQFIKAMEYILAAVRCRQAASLQDTTTAERLERFADVQSERGRKALSDIWQMA